MACVDIYIKSRKPYRIVSFTCHDGKCIVPSKWQMSCYVYYQIGLSRFSSETTKRLELNDYMSPLQS